MAAITGEAVHALLAAVVDTQADRFKTKCERLWADVYMRFPDITDWVPLRHMVEVLCSHPQTQDVFMPREGVVFCEQEFIDENAQSHRVDRVHITATHVNVYDYKTAAEDPSHHAQIKGYMDLLGRIYPGRTVRGYVIYVDPVRMLEVAV
jgi:ATP-dependent exoDNAse (exonuclease V) beta subunit